jgi:hypothetical protein
MYYNTNTNKFRCYQNGWTDCITAAGANAALSNLASVAINQSLIAGTTNSIDLGSSGTTWRAGYFGTSLSSPVIRPAADGTAAFKIQNTAGTVDYWTLDTTNSRVSIGTSNTTGTLFVLDTKTDVGDPTGVDGAMYYNSSDKSFKCYKNGLWQDCNFASLRSDWVVQEEFANISTATTTTGEQGWTSATIGATGTATKLSAGANSANYDRFGILQIASAATTANTGWNLRLDTTGMTGVPTNMMTEFDFGPVSANAAAATNQTTYIGLHNGVANTTAPTDGLYFRYTSTVTAGNWDYCVQATCTGSGVARTTTANQYQRFKIQTNAAGTSVQFFINETSVGTVSSGLPTQAAGDVYGPSITSFVGATAPATAFQWKMDYFQVKRNLTTLR